MASTCFEETVMRPIVSALLLAAVAIACSKAAPAQTLADIVLLNGKIVTVDDRFTIAEALAIKGERILAVGNNAEVEKHKGPLTRVVDLNRRTVVPGLIDNPAHYMRAAEYWHVKYGSTASRRTKKPSIRSSARRPNPSQANGWLCWGAGRKSSSWTNRAASAGQSSMASRPTIRWRSNCSTFASTPIPRRSR